VKLDVRVGAGWIKGATTGVKGDPQEGRMKVSKSREARYRRGVDKASIPKN